jgi:hypothetical protein
MDRYKVENEYRQDEWLLNPGPRLRGTVPLLTVATAVGLPFSLVAGFIVNGRPVDGLIALPLLVGLVGLKLYECLSK